MPEHRLRNPLISLTRRRILRVGGALIFYPLFARAAVEKKLQTRLWPSEEYTRLVVETDHEIAFRTMRLRDPERLVVDLEKTELNETFRHLPGELDPSDPYIKAIRVGYYQADLLRLVFDLKSEVDPQIFTLKPVADFGYRLVVDFYPKEPFDPLLLLVREFEVADSIDVLEEKYADDEELLTLVQEYERREAVKSQGKPSAAKPPVVTKPPTAQRKPPAVGKAHPILVMLDPGHGGEDPGAIGRRGTREKAVVLSIARRVKKLIDAETGMRAALTRDGDYFVPLRQRVDKARRVKADLVVSIHADAFTRSSARGSSVFALSNRGATSEAAHWLANKENNADLIGGINIKTSDATVAKTLLDLSQAVQISDSLKMGALILKELSQHNRLHKTKVEQAGFAVLKAPDIPSVLVETAFISNPEEEAKLRSADHQQRFARSIAQGIIKYFRQNPARSRG